MSDKMINEESDKQALKHRKLWKRDPSEWGVWWEHNWKSFVDYNDMKERLKKVLILGITKKYSEPIPGIDKPKPKRDDTIETFENLPQYTTEEKSTIEDNKQKFINEVAQ